MSVKKEGGATKWVRASIQDSWFIRKQGIQFEVWEKKNGKRRKLGTLVISVGGLRWKPKKGPSPRPKGWRQLAEWFVGDDV